MRKRAIITLLGGAALLLHVVLGNAAVAFADAVVERLSLPESIDFNGESYRLSWSSHPTTVYYKQEYVPQGQTNDRFQRMVMVEAIVRGTDVNAAVSAQVGMLNKRKATDPTVNFAIVKNEKSGEVILDFILSAKDPKGEDIVEWNAYRYSSLKGKGGEAGVLLFAISRRAYGDGTSDFLRKLKSTRPDEINALAAYLLPAIRPRE